MSQTVPVQISSLDWPAVATPKYGITEQEKFLLKHQVSEYYVVNKK